MFVFPVTMPIRITVTQKTMTQRLLTSFPHNISLQNASSLDASRQGDIIYPCDPSSEEVPLFATIVQNI